MQKWEYCMLEDEYYWAWLHQKGTEGWELVTAVPRDDRKWALIMKRPKAW
jgi:hypothetical protein